MKLVDTHAHVLKKSWTNYDEVLKRTVENIYYLFNIAFDLKSTNEVIALNKTHHNFFPVVGIHPNHSEINDAKNLLELEDIIKKNITNIVAIGEIGLDYFRLKNTKEQQNELFIKQILLARKFNLPIVVHTRDSLHECWEIIKQYPDQKFLLHSWSGDIQLTTKILKKSENIWFSFNGIITFKNALMQKEVLKIIPLDKLLIETDCPYLTPVPIRGRPNIPENVRYVLAYCANLLTINIEDFILQTSKNAQEFYGVTFN